MFESHKIIQDQRRHAEIMQDVRKYFQEATQHVDVEKGMLLHSGIWGAPNKFEMWQLGRDSSLTDAVAFAQEGKLICLNHLTDEKYYGMAVEELQDQLEKLGVKISEEIGESPVSSPKVAVKTQEGYYISPDFLYKMNIATRLKHITGQPGAVVLEIGGGLGTLARCIKLNSPKVKYRILDLKETLVFSYMFLRANFPEATFKFITSADQLKENLDQYDFVFIPANFHPSLPAWDITLVANTHSLGEMKQSIVEDYMKMIQSRLNVQYLYSMNRYLQITEEMGDVFLSGDYQATCSLVLDPYWEVMHWDYTPQISKSMRYYPTDRTKLEVLLKRVPSAQRERFDPKQKSQACLEQAKKYENAHGHKWMRCMWESVMYAPSAQNLLPYFDFLSRIKAREIVYFHPIVKGLNPSIPELPVEKNGFKKVLSRKLMSVSRRVARM